MQKALLILSSFLIVSCSSGETSPAPEPCAVDAGPDASACTHCADVAIAADANEDPLPLIAALCPASVPIWQAIPVCGCGDAGACALACKPSLWCDALPKSIWVQPDAECAACLPSLNGCGAELEACFADR